MTRSRALLVPAASLAAALGLSACVPPGASAESPFAEFASADDDRQVELLLAAEDAVAAVIADGPDAAGALGATRVDTRQLVFRDIGSITQALGEILHEGQLVDQFEGQVGWSDGRHVAWRSDDAGSVSGSFEYDGAGSSSGSTFSLSVCPDATGTFSGRATLDGEAGGVSWDLELGFSGKVGDDAFADEMVVEAGGTLDAGGITQDATTTVSFGFGERGTFGVNGDGSAGAGDNSWDQAVDDLSSKAALRFARLIEENWHSGRCVGLTAAPAPASVAPGGEVDFAVQPFSKVDGADIEEGSVEGAVVAGEGSVSPEGEQMVGTPFTYAAPDEPGTATVQFMSISRRGVGLVEVPVEISSGWFFEATYADISSSALKCGGLTGSWEIGSTGPRAYQASTTWTFDASLRATAVTSGTAGGYPFSGPKEVWVVESGPGQYELHWSDGPNVFSLEPAPAGACD